MSIQTIRIMCPNLMCRRVLAVPADARGKTVRCRGCGSRILIPQKRPPHAPATQAQVEPDKPTDASAA